MAFFKYRADANSAWQEIPIIGSPGQDGQDGANGQDGADGISPVITITTITGGHRLTITDADHPDGQTVDIMDGAKGDTGATGPAGTYTAGSNITINNGVISAAGKTYIDRGPLSLNPGNLNNVSIQTAVQSCCDDYASYLNTLYLLNNNTYPEPAYSSILYWQGNTNGLYCQVTIEPITWKRHTYLPASQLFGQLTLYVGSAVTGEWIYSTFVKTEYNSSTYALATTPYVTNSGSIYLPQDRPSTWKVLCGKSGENDTWKSLSELGGGGGVTYTAGTGISIDSNNVISVNIPNGNGVSY